jgi:hypothetical protein
MAGAVDGRIVFPFDEHMHVIHGVLKITDSEESLGIGIPAPHISSREGPRSCGNADAFVPDAVP